MDTSKQTPQGKPNGQPRTSRLLKHPGFTWGWHNPQQFSTHQPPLLGGRRVGLSQREENCPPLSAAPDP